MLGFSLFSNGSHGIFFRTVPRMNRIYRIENIINKALEQPWLRMPGRRVSMGSSAASGLEMVFSQVLCGFINLCDD
jgi:hypothetical protein